MKKNLPIPRIPAINSMTGFEKYFSKQQPVIINNLIAGWPQIKLWTPQFIAKECYAIPIKLCVLKQEKNPTVFMDTTVDQAISLILSNQDATQKYYLVSEQLKNLTDPLTAPLKYQKDMSYEKNIWLGEKGNVSILHFDTMHNLLTQFSGKKKVYLFAPDDYHHLYPFINSEELPSNYSQIKTTDTVDLKKFPLFANTIRLEGTLNPGDVLFIPPGWWHEVHSLEISLSVNFWWPTHLGECKLSHLFKDFIYDLIGTNDFKQACQRVFIESNTLSDLAVAEILFHHGEYWLAVVFVAHFLLLPLATLPKESKQVTIPSPAELIDQHYHNHFTVSTLNSMMSLVEKARQQNDQIFAAKQIEFFIDAVKSLNKH